MNENELQSDFKRYTITELNHEVYKKYCVHSGEEMIEQFIEIIESQNKYNTETTIGAIPIFIYHSGDYSGEGYSINPDLLEKEMKTICILI
jgi:hypothetical protein